MSGLSYAVIVLLLCLLWISCVVNRIPKTGRDGTASGEKIKAKITNENKNADSPVTLRAVGEGRKFKVKMKPTEARLWIKGDSIEIILAENKKSYRVLFNDYFRTNESRIREKTLQKLEKAVKLPISSAILKLEKDTVEQIENSNYDSQVIFTLATYLRVINLYTIIAVLLTVATLVWKSVTSPSVTMIILAVFLILITAWSVYGAVTACKRILKKIQK